MDPVYSKDQSGQPAEKTRQTSCGPDAGGAEGAAEHKKSCRQQVVVQEETVVHWKGNLLWGGGGQIAQETDRIPSSSAQVNCESGTPVQGDPIQKTAQQKITGPPGDQGLKQLDVKGKNPVENGAEGGWEQDHCQQNGKLARSTVVGDPPKKGAQEVEPEEAVNEPHVEAHTRAEQQAEKMFCREGGVFPHAVIDVVD